MNLSAYEQGQTMLRNAQLAYHQERTAIAARQQQRSALQAKIAPHRTARAAGEARVSAAHDRANRCESDRLRLDEAVVVAEQQVAEAQQALGCSTPEQVRAYFDETKQRAADVAARQGKQSRFVGARMAEKDARERLEADGRRLDEREAEAARELREAEAAVHAADSAVASIEAKIAALGDIDADDEASRQRLRVAQERAAKISRGDYSEALGG